MLRQRLLWECFLTWEQKQQIVTAANLRLQDMDADPYQTEGSVYNTSDLTRPEYSTDNFRMFCFK